ncbi:hypothetical protein LCGC14_1806290 [marine sediment metagenome]|uniref:Uncharacterized protein n=1 Tax=marine sediment metagenome TaxID=412755 RepID=A0A0F9J2W4_9ZZZZ
MTDKERKDKVGETNFKISMDISPEEFAKKQAEQRAVPDRRKGVKFGKGYPADTDLLAEEAEIYPSITLEDGTIIHFNCCLCNIPNGALDMLSGYIDHFIKVCNKEAPS